MCLRIKEPNAAQGAIDSGQIINAIVAMIKIEVSKSESALRNIEAAVVEIVQALGLIT